MPWECFECTFVQEGSPSGRGPCIVCMHDNPLCIKVEVEDASASPSPAPKITGTDMETKDLMSDAASLKAFAEAIRRINHSLWLSKCLIIAPIQSCIVVVTGRFESHKYPHFRQKAYPLARGVYP